MMAKMKPLKQTTHWLHRGCTRCSVFAIGAIGLIATLTLWVSPAHGLTMQDEIALAPIDEPMAENPRLDEPVAVQTYNPRQLQLLIKALGRPDTETARRAAAALGDAAEKGWPDIQKQTQAKLEKLVESDATHPMSRQAAADALIRMDARSSAAILLQATHDGLKRSNGTLALMVDPVLSQWGTREAMAVWMQRLADPACMVSVRVSAAKAMANYHGAISSDVLPSVIKLLVSLAKSNQEPITLRLAAADALATHSTSGLTARFNEMAGKSFTERLIAARALAGQTDGGALGLMTSLLEDPKPSVAFVAGQFLLKRDLSRLAGKMTPFAVSDDARLRMLAVHVFFQRADRDSISKLVKRLDDRDPAVRSHAREALRLFDKNTLLRSALREQLNGVLAVADSELWRGLEQAAHLVGLLDEEPAAKALVGLLDHPRGEVAVAAAVALRRIKVASTYPDLVKYADGLFANYKNIASGKKDANGPRTVKVVGAQMRELMQLFGAERYQPAHVVARLLIPKDSYDGTARAAAVWALGRFYENDPQEDLSRLLSSRMRDNSPMAPEVDRVRQMSAITIGRMKDLGQLGTMRRMAETEMELIQLVIAARWAVEHMTGETLPALSPSTSEVTGFFIEPLR